VRPFRGSVYEIEILNPEGLQKGKISIEVDGKPIPDQVIRPHQDGQVHRVRVVLERPQDVQQLSRRQSFASK